MKFIGKLAKWFFIGVGALVILGIIIAVAGGDDQPTTQPKQEQTAPAKQEPVKKEEPAQKITKENYDKIKQGDTLSGEGGMTIEEVVAILGKPDSQLESTMTIGSKEVKTENYSWSSLSLHSISITFTNGKVSSKMWME